MDDCLPKSDVRRAGSPSPLTYGQLRFALKHHPLQRAEEKKRCRQDSEAAEQQQAQNLVTHCSQHDADSGIHCIPASPETAGDRNAPLPADNLVINGVRGLNNDIHSQNVQDSVEDVTVCEPDRHHPSLSSPFLVCKSLEGEKSPNSSQTSTIEDSHPAPKLRLLHFEQGQQRQGPSLQHSQAVVTPQADKEDIKLAASVVRIFINNCGLLLTNTQTRLPSQIRKSKKFVEIHRNRAPIRSHESHNGHHAARNAPQNALHADEVFAWPTVREVPSNCSQTFAVGDAFKGPERLPPMPMGTRKRRLTDHNPFTLSKRRYIVLQVDNGRPSLQRPTKPPVKRSAKTPSRDLPSRTKPRSPAQNYRTGTGKHDHEDTAQSGTIPGMSDISHITQPRSQEVLSPLLDRLNSSRATCLCSTKINEIRATDNHSPEPRQKELTHSPNSTCPDLTSTMSRRKTAMTATQSLHSNGHYFTPVSLPNLDGKPKDSETQESNTVHTHALTQNGQDGNAYDSETASLGIIRYTIPHYLPTQHELLSSFERSLVTDRDADEAGNQNLRHELLSDYLPEGDQDISVTPVNVQGESCKQTRITSRNKLVRCRAMSMELKSTRTSKKRLRESPIRTSRELKRSVTFDIAQQVREEKQSLLRIAGASQAADLSNPPLPIRPPFFPPRRNTAIY